MPPKRKSASPPTGGKLVKKPNQVKGNSIPSLKEDDDIAGTKSGKIVLDSRNEVKGFCLFTTKYVPLDPLDNNNSTNQVELPNLALNQYLKQKSKKNLQGSYKWKAFLFPYISKYILEADISHL